MIMELLKSLKRYKSFIVIELCTLVTRTRTRNERLGRLSGDDDASHCERGKCCVIAVSDANILV